MSKPVTGENRWLVFCCLLRRKIGQEGKYRANQIVLNQEKIVFYSELQLTYGYYLRAGLPQKTFSKNRSENRKKMGSFLQGKSVQ